MKTLKIGIIGIGFIGRQHVDAISRIPYAQIVAISDQNYAAARELAEQFQIPRCYETGEELIADPEVEIVHNCTPNVAHYALNKLAIESGKHIYSEKPLAMTGKQAAELVTLAREHCVANGVNFNYRHNIALLEMRERVRSGAAGRVFTVYGQYLQDWLASEDNYDWRVDPAIGGASRALADIGSHCFDSAQFVMGQRIRRVYARLIKAYPFRRKTAPGETFAKGTGEGEMVPVQNEDGGFVLAEFEDGTPANFYISQVCNGRKNDQRIQIAAEHYSMEWCQERADELQIGYQYQGNETVLTGTNGIISDTARHSASLPSGHAEGWAYPHKYAISRFYDSIRDGSYQDGNLLYTTFYDAGQIMKLVDACLLSDRENRWVEV